MKTCIKCNKEKPLKDFYKHKSNKDGRDTRCKECLSKKYKKKYNPRKKQLKICIGCGKEFKGYKNKKYCSSKCMRGIDIICIGCGKEATVVTKGAKYCTDACFHEHTDYRHIKEWTTIKECESCGKEYETGSQSSRYCSGECNPSNAERTNVYFNRCICGEHIVSKDNKKFCDDKCESLNASLNAHYLGTHYHLKEDNTCLCTECGEEYYRPYGYKSTNRCSNECQESYRKRCRKERKYARKALKRNASRTEHINPYKVMKRDNYRCRMCGCKTPKKLRGTYEGNAPEIDHIIPLSKAGNHTYNNVQLLCRKCNGEKSDKIMGQQPLVFNGVAGEPTHAPLTS